MNKRALVTLLIGERTRNSFNKNFRVDWESYCLAHNLDLVLVDTLLDDSPRALGRSPAWQKCILHKYLDLSRYEQVAWIDADIKIKSSAPNIFDSVPSENIGAVDAFGIPTYEDHNFVLKNLYQTWKNNGVSFIEDSNPQKYHENFGLEGKWEGAVQTGVLVFSPARHAKIFQRAYDNYEDKGKAFWHFEMRPLSHEILTSGFLKWISPKFNMIWSYYQECFFPFFSSYKSKSMLRRLLDRTDGYGFQDLRRMCVETAFRNNHFLHFAGRSKDFELLR